MWLKVILLKLSLHWMSENWDLFRLRGKIKGRRIPQQWIMINSTGRTATVPPAGCTESESGPTVPKRWVLKAPWKKDYGCLCWPSGSLPAAQVCKLLKAAELRLNPESFFTQFTLRTRWQGWALSRGNPLCFVPLPPPYAHSPSLKCDLYLMQSHIKSLSVFKSPVSITLIDITNTLTYYILVSRDNF